MYRSFNSLFSSWLVFSKSKKACQNQFNAFLQTSIQWTIQVLNNKCHQVRQNITCATVTSNSEGSASLSLWIFCFDVYIFTDLFTNQSKQKLTKSPNKNYIASVRASTNKQNYNFFVYSSKYLILVLLTKRHIIIKSSILAQLYKSSFYSFQPHLTSAQWSLHYKKIKPNR